MEEPTNCDRCAANFLSHKILWCPDCDSCLCESCYNEASHDCVHNDDYLEEFWFWDDEDSNY